MKIVLILILWAVAGGEPTAVKVDAPDLKTCFEQAQKFIESDTVKKAAAASAGCTVVNAPSTDS